MVSKFRKPIKLEIFEVNAAAELASTVEIFSSARSGCSAISPGASHIVKALQNNVLIAVTFSLLFMSSMRFATFTLSTSPPGGAE